MCSDRYINRPSCIQHGFSSLVSQIILPQSAAFSELTFVETTLKYALALFFCGHSAGLLPNV